MAGLFASSEPERSRIAVTITLASGEALSGNILLPATHKLREFVNLPDRFVEFERRDQAILHLAKTAILSIAPLDLPRADQLSRRIIDARVFDPHAALGIERSAGPGEIRAAYWAKAKLYHPDKLAGKEAPKEVTDYMNAMFVRITAAYRELSGERAD